MIFWYLTGFLSGWLVFALLLFLIADGCWPFRRKTRWNWTTTEHKRARWGKP